jgi:hypothetical protein
VGPRAGLDTEDREKNPLPLSGLESRSPSRPARSQDTILPELPGSLGKIGDNPFGILSGYLSKKVQNVVVTKTCFVDIRLFSLWT